MADFDYTRELDKVKAGVFLGNNAAFLGSLMCSLGFQWDEDIGTAATNGETILWDKAFFRSSGINLRKFTLLHELWHVARLHPLRRGSRDPEDWNKACDLRINYDLVSEGFKFDDFTPWYDVSVGNMSEEEIYDKIRDGTIDRPTGGWIGGSSGGDIEPMPKNFNPTAMVSNVVQAVQQSKLAGAGSGLGGIEKIVSEFLTSIIPWQTHLYKFFTDMEEGGFTWARPNRRYPDLYLPSRTNSEGRLAHLAYYCDVSGSVADHDVLRFNSEVKYVKDTFVPEMLTLIQFDDDITRIDVFDENTPFDKVVTVGRGGTNLEPVRQHIIKTRPTAAIIFSDLHCSPMQKIPFNIPVIWVIVGNPHATVPFGQVIHI